MPANRPSRRFPTLALAALACWPILAGTGAAAADNAPQPDRPIETLERLWPGHPEWAAMLVDILDGSQLGPQDGWFRKAHSQTRYGWKAAAARLDRDGDGTIGPAEFAGSRDDFDRLDRDHDGLVTADDFDFNDHALTPSPGAMLFYRADRDGNGKLTPGEIDAYFKAADRDGLGFLSLSDLQQLVPGRPPARRRPDPSQAAAAAAAASSEGPTRATLLRGLYRQEIGSLSPGPAVGDHAPDFALKAADGDREVRLSELPAGKPVVLVFGNFTCGPFRSQAGNVEALYRRYKDRASFVMVYVREAHPTDGWQMDSNNRVGVAIRQPQNYDEREQVARTCGKTLDLGLPMVVDAMDDRVGARYSGMPSRLYLIDPKGVVAFKSGRGPFGFKTAELEQSLILELQAESSAGPPPAAVKAAEAVVPAEDPSK